MSDVFDLEIRYKDELEISKAYLSSSAKRANRSSATPVQKAHLLKMKADCPLCGDPFHGANHNTEHIFPISLGGKNTVNNKIQLCKMCNKSRNKVMQSIIPGDDVKSNYPEMKTEIKRLLLWHLITIDDGIQAGSLIPSIHDLFMTFSTGGKPFPNKPNRAYGRFSTWKIGDEPNYPANHFTFTKKLTLQSKPSPTWRSIGRNLLDKFFLYEPKGGGQPTQIETDVVGVKPPISQTSKPPKSPSVTKPVKKLPDDVDKDAFVNAIMQLISPEEGSKFQLQTSFIGEVGRRIRIMQDANEWKEVGTRPYLLHHGFPGNFGLLNALKTCFGNQLEIIGVHPNQKVRIQSEPQSEPKPDTASTSFPLITRFNSTSSGLKLPRHPRQFVECLVTFHQKQSEIQSTAEIAELFKQILNSNQAHRMAYNTVSILFPDDLTPINQKGWTTATPLDDLLHFSELFRDKILATKIVVEEQEYVAHTNVYFDMVKELL